MQPPGVPDGSGEALGAGEEEPAGWHCQYQGLTNWQVPLRQHTEASAASAALLKPKPPHCDHSTTCACIVWRQGQQCASSSIMPPPPPPTHPPTLGRCAVCGRCTRGACSSAVLHAKRAHYQHSKSQPAALASVQSAPGAGLGVLSGAGLAEGEGAGLLVSGVLPEEESRHCQNHSSTRWQLEPIGQQMDASLASAALLLLRPPQAPQMAACVHGSTAVAGRALVGNSKRNAAHLCIAAGSPASTV